MKILHTSDWHIGRQLYGRKRYPEFESFLQWLANLIESEKIDTLLVSGDIFDTPTPSNRSQKLYYQFLCRVCSSALSNVVITGGNHDSPSFLNAPRELLGALNVHVVGAAGETPEDEVILLKNQSGNVQAVILAVPYLRDRDVRTALVGEDDQDKHLELVKGIKEHYEKVAQAALPLLKSNPDVPVVAMGHLFAAGGKTLDGDGVRELYVGSVARVGLDVFPDIADYVALGHLHVPQVLKGTDHIRYSGSPFPMGFSEANQKKSVVVVRFEGKTPEIELFTVPVFQKLSRIKGDIEQINTAVEALKDQERDDWLEIEYAGSNIPGNLKTQVEELVEGSRLEIRRILNPRVFRQVADTGKNARALDELTVSDVFLKLLEINEVEPDQKEELIRAHQEIETLVKEEDIQQE